VYVFAYMYIFNVQKINMYFQYLHFLISEKYKIVTEINITQLECHFFVFILLKTDFINFICSSIFM